MKVKKAGRPLGARCWRNRSGPHASQRGPGQLQLQPFLQDQEGRQPGWEEDVDVPPAAGEARIVKGPSGRWTVVNFPPVGMGCWEERWARVTNLYPFRKVPKFLWVLVAKRRGGFSIWRCGAAIPLGPRRSRSRCTAMGFVGRIVPFPHSASFPS